jgi:hypothetical protein
MKNSDSKRMAVLKALDRLAFTLATCLLVPAIALAADASSKLPVQVVPASAPSITVDNYTPHAGDNVTVTVNPGSFTSSSNDSVSFAWGDARFNCHGSGPNAAPQYNVKGPGSFQVQIPYIASEIPQSYILLYKLQDSSGTHCDGEPTTFAAQSAVITVPPTVPTPSITAAPPSDVTAPPPGWPATSGRTMTMCASGCQYTDFGDALWDAANNNPVDYTKIEIAAGAYANNCRWGGGNGPAHLWIHGHGGGFARITGTCGVAINNGWRGQFVMDNVELSGGGIGTGGNCPNILLRNIYVHDIQGQGISVGVMCDGINITVLNSRVSRAGGPIGPAHDVYFGDNNQNETVTVKRSVFEASQIGHTFKTRVRINLFDCDMFMQGYDPIYNGSQIIDMDSAAGQTTIQNSLLAKGPYWRDGFQNNYISMEYAVDVETSDPGPPNYLVLKNNIFIMDLGTIVTPFVNPAGQHGVFIAANRPLRSGPSAPLPSVWSNNKLVGPRGYHQFANGGPYIDPGYYFPYAIPGGGANASDVDLGTPAGSSCPQCVAYDTGTPNSHGNLFYSSRAAAGIGAISPGPGVYYLWPYDRSKFPMPSACTDPVGNVAVPRLEGRRR